MNRLQKLFEKKRENILSVYFTAGYPTLDSAVEIINTLDSRGADMIEVGVPFSDPMADGPVIQESSTVALRNGMKLAKVLDDVAQARKNSPDIPLVLMGYLNPIYHMGFEKCFARCVEVGIDALIIPDLPFDIYLTDIRPLCVKYDIPLIMLITPETSDERIHLIDDNCDGFIYMVSSASTTGAKDRFTDEQYSYFDRLDRLSLKHPRLIGFGISTPETFNDACRHSSGAIIGSKFIKCLDETTDFTNPSKTDIPAAVDKLLESLGR